MRHIWSVICSSSSIDIRTNNISLFNVFERLEFTIEIANEELIQAQQGEIAIPIPLEFVTLWLRSEAEIPEVALGRLLLLTPNNGERFLHEFNIDTSVHHRARTIAQLQGFPYSGNGIYQFVIQIKNQNNWETISQIPLEVFRQEA